jgi:hypothetical protein
MGRNVAGLEAAALGVKCGMQGEGGQMIFHVRGQCMLVLFGETSSASMEVSMDFVR